MKVSLSPAALLQHAARAMQRGGVTVVSGSHVPVQNVTKLQCGKDVTYSRNASSLSCGTPLPCSYLTKCYKNILKEGRCSYISARSISA